MPGQRALGAKIDGPRYKWNGVYNQYLSGGICAPFGCLAEASASLGSETKTARGRRATRKLSRFLRTRLYLSNWCPRLSVPRPVLRSSWPRHLHTRNKSNSEIIIPCGKCVVFIIGHCLPALGLRFFFFSSSFLFQSNHLERATLARAPDSFSSGVDSPFSRA